MLTISRPDVEWEVLTDFPMSERLIKLPIGRYLEMMFAGKEDETNNAQRALINAVNNPKYRFVCAALARRLGKTFIANIIGQLVTLVPGSNVLIMSPNYSLSTISFELQRRFINKFGLEIVRDNLKDKVIELSNGSTIRMGSVMQVDSCVGRSYDLIIFDESALSSHGKDAFNVALRPTLDKPGSKAIFISTPRGRKNWFSEFYNRGFTDEFPTWVSIHADYKENSRMTEADVAEAKRSMSKAEFEQEYMASFNTFEGAIYHFNESGQDVIDYYPDLTDSFEVFAGLDPGYRDPTAMIVIAYCSDDDCFYVIDDYLEAEKTTNKHAESIIELRDKYEIETIFIDAAAAQMGADLAYTYDIATSKAKKNVLEGIAYCQSIIEQGRLKVHRNCLHTLEALDQYQWNQSETLTKEKAEHNMASHIADAMRYALYTFSL
jgi:phage terminase large subunit